MKSRGPLRASWRRDASGFRLQRCQDFFEQYQARRGAPSEPCATAIATYAVCMPEYGCPSAPPCEEHSDWDPLRDLYLAECEGP